MRRKDWTVVKWSALSPDLNPTERLWKELKLANQRELTGAVCSRRVGQTLSGEVEKPYSDLQKVLNCSYFLQRLCYKILTETIFGHVTSNMLYCTK